MRDTTLSTVIAPDHLLSPATRKGVLKYAADLPWMVGISDPVNWQVETIGHKRLNELYKIGTKWVFCLDSDDELIGHFPDDMSGFEDLDFLLFWSIRHDGEQKKLIKGRGWTQSATARVLFKTDFLISILEEFVETPLVREDLFMMWKALERGRLAYIPRFILKKHGTRCSADEWFRKRAQNEPKKWSRIFNKETNARFNQKIQAAEVSG
jgi:hypothetical protein